MNFELEQKLCHAGKENRTYSKETWHEIIDALLDDFRDFVGEDFQRDPEIKLKIEKPQNQAFSRWFWTEEKVKTPLAVTWSAMIGGDMVGTEKLPGDTFLVSIVLFLFDATGNNRLRLKTGESYLSFGFTKKIDGCGCWCNYGWFKDEWGEWESLG